MASMESHEVLLWKATNYVAVLGVHKPVKHTHFSREAE
jgi:hypothetical protein